MKLLSLFTLLLTIFVHRCCCVGPIEETQPIIVEDVVSRALSYLISGMGEQDVVDKLKEILAQLPDSSKKTLLDWLLYGNEAGSVKHDTDIKSDATHAAGSHDSLHSNEDAEPNGKGKVPSSILPGEKGCGCRESLNMDGKVHYTRPKVVSAAALGDSEDAGGCCTSFPGVKATNTAPEQPMSCGMPAYFHNSYKSVILFNFWRTTNAKDYFPTLFLISFLALFTVWLKYIRKKLTEYFLKRTDGFPEPLAQITLVAIASAVTFMDFCMMLIAMTFNVGIVTAVCVAYGIGYALIFYIFAGKEGSEIQVSDECEADCC